MREARISTRVNALMKAGKRSGGEEREVDAGGKAKAIRIATMKCSHWLA